MEVCALNLNSGGFVFGSRTKSPFDDDAVSGLGSKRVAQFKVRDFPYSYRTLSVRASGKKNHGNPSPSSGNNDPLIPEEGDSSEDINPSYEKSIFDDPIHKSDRRLPDWRDFRALHVCRQHELLDSKYAVDKTFYSRKTSSQKLEPKWAHPLSFLEPGCILVATEKLDGVRSFERSVVLLLRLGSRDPKEGPFGIIINRPLDKKIRHMNPSKASELATTFSQCPLHFGGPLDTSIFLMKTDDALAGFHPGLHQVVPGICYGTRNVLQDAAGLVRRGVLRSEDFKFFVGYAGWQLDQLHEEIASDYWILAACSSNLISRRELSRDSASGLWAEILELMGGEYSELSRKPKKDSP